MRAHEEPLSGLAGVGHIFLHGEGWVMTGFAAIRGLYLPLSFAGMRGVAADAGHDSLLEVSRLDCRFPVCLFFTR